MIRVKLVQVNKDSEMVMSMETFEDAQKYNYKDVRKWVKVKAAEYSKKPGFENTEDHYYEFRYEKWNKIPYHVGTWGTVAVEFLIDKL